MEEENETVNEQTVLSQMKQKKQNECWINGYYSDGMLWMEEVYMYDWAHAFAII